MWGGLQRHREGVGAGWGRGSVPGSREGPAVTTTMGVAGLGGDAEDRGEHG